MLVLATVPYGVQENKKIYYMWDSATYGTEIVAPCGQIGAQAYAYADTYGLIKVYAKGGATPPVCGWFSHVGAWGELYITVKGDGHLIVPILNYTVNGWTLNGGLATIKLVCIDRTTGKVVGSWSKELPVDCTTEYLFGEPPFRMEDGRDYLFYVRVYAEASICLIDCVSICVDYGESLDDDEYVKVNYLYLFVCDPDIKGDINGDRKVDSIDLGIVYQALGSNSETCDLNHDGKVNYQDLGLEFVYYLGWQTRYYTYAPPIETTATAFGQAINKIRQKYP